MDMLQIKLNMIYRTEYVLPIILYFVERYRNVKVSLFNSDDYTIKKYIFTMTIMWTGCGFGFPASGTVKGAKKDYAFVVSGRVGIMSIYYYNNIS